MPELNTQDIQDLLKTKYNIDPANIKPEDIPQIVTYVMEFIESSATMTNEQRKQYVITAITELLKNTKFTQEEKDNMQESVKTLVNSYIAVEKTAEVVGLLSKKGGCCVIV
jgi:nucleoid-associated protein YejK